MSRRPSSRRSLLALAALVGAVALLWKVLPVTRTFDAFEMHGGPVVVRTGDHPSVVALTSHWETPRVTSTRYAYRRKSKLHWDVWAFSTTDLSRRFITRLATVTRGERSLDAGILGVTHDVVWMIADGLMAVSLADGHVVADAAGIEARNAPLKGLMPTSRKQMYFDNGLVLIAADGQRWRIHHETLMATPDTAVASASLIGVPTSRATLLDQYLPLRLGSQYQAFKWRDFVVGDRWYGMMHPSELELQRTDPHTQNFALGLRYRLWTAPMVDTVDRFRRPGRRPVDFVPTVNSPEFLLGGLLSISDSPGRAGVVGIRSPTRFLVLHQSRIDTAATQTLTCVTLDGSVCWNAPLGVSLATGFAPLSTGGPDDWALIVVGQTHARRTDSRSAMSGDEVLSLLRVSMRDGAVRRMSFGDVDLETLAGELRPYRAR